MRASIPSDDVEIIRAQLEKMNEQDRQRWLEGDWHDVNDAYDPELPTKPAFDKAKTIAAIVIMICAIVVWACILFVMWPYMPK